jgi:hypothetical protein
MRLRINESEVQTSGSWAEQSGTSRKVDGGGRAPWPGVWVMDLVPKLQTGVLREAPIGTNGPLVLVLTFAVLRNAAIPLLGTHIADYSPARDMSDEPLNRGVARPRGK